MNIANLLDQIESYKVLCEYSYIYSFLKNAASIPPWVDKNDPEDVRDWLKHRDIWKAQRAEILNKDPQALAKYREELREAYHKHKAKMLKIDPEAYKNYNVERRKRLYETEKMIKAEGGLDGLMIKLRNHLSSKKRDLLKFKNQDKINTFDNDLKRINILREKINEVLGNYVDGMPAGLKELPSIIEFSKKLSEEMESRYGALGKTLKEITTKLNELHDSYKTNVPEVA